MPRVALGKQGLHVIHQSAEVSREIDRNALRQRVEEASKRPAPGTSNLLQVALDDVVVAGKHFKGAWDATGLLPVHLLLKG